MEKCVCFRISRQKLEKRTNGLKMEKNTDETLIKNDTSKSFFLNSGLPRDAPCKSQQEKK